MLVLPGNKQWKWFILVSTGNRHCTYITDRHLAPWMRWHLW